MMDKTQDILSKYKLNTFKLLISHFNFFPDAVRGTIEVSRLTV